MMTFAHPTLLALLWLLPLLAGLLVYAHKKRLTAAQRFIDERMMSRLIPMETTAQVWLKGILLLAGLALVIVALAGPRYGTYYEKVARRGVDCFVCLDVSRSMLAEDVKPNRLERAKADIRDLLTKLGGDRVGLIVFAGKAVVRVPLTTDDGFFRQSLDDVDVKSAPRGGTLIGDAIRKAMESMPKRADSDQVIVLITDGEDQESMPEQAAKHAAEQGIKIFTVGLGDSSEGARIPVVDSAGNKIFAKDEKGEHWSKVDQDLLKKIALDSGGAYIPAGTRTYDLGQVYEENLSGLARGEEAEKQLRKREQEWYQVALFFGIALLAVERAVPRCPRKNGNTNSAASGFAMFFVIALFSSSAHADVNAAANKAKEGIEQFQNRDFKAALKAFEEAENAAPDDLRLAFNRGCAYAAQNEAEKAIEQFQKSAAAADKKLAALSNYNLGCLDVVRAKAKFGKNPEEAEEDARKQGMEMIDAAGRHFRDALNLDSQDEEARYNLETLRAWKRYIQKVWKQRDLASRREKLNLLDYMQLLETEERGLRTKVKELQSEEKDSPRKRQLIRETENAQRELAEEIGPLEQKFDQLAAGQGRGPGANAQLPADAQKAVEMLKSMADQVGKSMQAAADRMRANSLQEAIEPQTSAIENIDQIFAAVAPYVNLVQRGIGRQEELIGSPKSSLKEEDAEPKSKKNGTPAQPDPADAAWNQQFIERYGKIIPLKAQHELKQLESQPTAQSSTAEEKEPKSDDAKKEEALKAEEQRRDLKEALQKGIELSPKVEQLARESAELLTQEKSGEALPKQQEALNLLKEMLPKQQQQEQQKDEEKKEQEKKDQEKKDQDKKNQDKKDQEKKDQEKKDQDKKDQQKKDQEKKDQEKKDQDKKDQQKKDQEKKDKEKKEQQKQDQQKGKQNQQQSQQQAGKKQEIPKEQADEMLRRVRLRQEYHKELQKELEGYLEPPEKVEKDW